MTDAVGLTLWRRLDWRFLLPQPLSGRLLLGGRPDALLLTALGLLEEVTLAGDDETADLLYLVDPDRTDLSRLLPRVRPGGMVYLEVSRRPGGQALRTTPGVWARRVRQAGVREVEVHWHAPDFTSRTRTVPCDHRASVLDTLARHDGRRGGRVQAGLGSALQRLHLLEHAVPHGSVLGVVP